MAFPPGTLHTKDGRTFVPITSDALAMHEANEHMLHRALMAQAIFTQPDFEIVVDCPKHGRESITWHEPMTVAQALADRRWTSPN